MSNAPKLGRQAFEAQFPNHDHYTEIENAHEADPEWYELPAEATGYAKGGKTAKGAGTSALVDHALRIAAKR